MEINESHIEKYVRFQDSLNPEEIEAVKNLISLDESAKKLFEFYTAFYTELDQINRPHRLTLSYFKPDAGLKAPFILAADSKKDDGNSIITRATFSSEETGTLVRILENKREQSYQLHVLSKLLDEEERVLIHINKPSLDFVTDKGGVLKNIRNTSFSTIDWPSLTLVLSLPRSNCSYHPEKGIITLCDECTLSVSVNNEFLFQTTETDIKKVLLEQGGTTELYSIEDRALTFQADRNQPFTIYLYS